MDKTAATKALGALSQETRLEAFRLLVRSGIQGMPAGAISRSLDVPHNTMSSHLSILANAALVRARREGRSIIYRVDFVGLRDLLSFLIEDCCRGRRDVCSPVLDSILSGCCAPGKKKGERNETPAC